MKIQIAKANTKRFIKIRKASLIINNSLTVFFTAGIIFLAQSVFGTTYYIDSLDGSDAETGLSSELAWKTIAKVNNTTFSPGDSILFKRGCIWREQLTIPSSGTQSSPITFGDYGTGNNPIIYRTELFSSNDENLWEHSLIGNGGVEAHSGTVNDSTTDTFYGWSNFIDGGAIQAVSDSYAGNAAVKIAKNSWIYQQIPVTPSTTYYLEFYGKKDGSTAGHIQIKDQTNGILLEDDGTWSSTGNIVNSLTVSETSWTRKSLSFTTSATSSAIQFRYLNRGTGNIYIDNVRMDQGGDNLIDNDGFETYTETIDDGVTDSFSYWNKMIPATTSHITAIRTTDSYDGTTVRLYRDGVDNACIYQQATISASTTYYLEFYGKKDTGAGNGYVEIRDQANGLYLQDNGSWSSTSNTIDALTVSETSWTQKSLSFTTSASSNAIQFRYTNQEGTGDIYLDDIYLNQGNSKIHTNVWAGWIANFANYWGTGAIDNGVRVPCYPQNGSQDPLTIEDEYFWCPISTSPCYFYYRKDAGIPSSLEVGARQYGILINGKNYITIDNIDVYGSGEAPLINIEGNSSNVIINGSEISCGNGVGIWTTNTTTNLIYFNLSVHDNANTGIYMNANGGEISYCKSYENGRVVTDSGDRGGIGSFEGGNILIEGNEVYRNGQGDQAADFEISVVGAVAPFTIVRNNVYDCLQGGIQIAEGGHDSIIAYNKINGFATSTTVSTSRGIFSAIRLGGGIGGDLSDIIVCNNLIAYGSTGGPATAGITVGTGVNDNLANLIIKNNICYLNECPDISVVNLSSSTFDFNKNDYYKTDYTNNWDWKGTSYSTLSTWQTASSQDSSSLTSNPLLIDPENGDFHLQSNSPAIDAGVDLDFTKDYEGTPVDANPDIGPDENRLGDSLTGNSGFEQYTGTIDDLSTDTFSNWNNMIDGGASRIEAVSASHDGSAALKIYRDGSYGAWVFQQMSVSPSTTYYLEFYGKKDAGAGNGYVQIKDQANVLLLKDDGTWSSTGNYVNGLTVSEISWTRKSLSFTTSAISSTIQFRYLNQSGTGNIYIDDICLIAQ